MLVPKLVPPLLTALHSELRPVAVWQQESVHHDVSLACRIDMPDERDPTDDLE